MDKNKVYMSGYITQLAKQVGIKTLTREYNRMFGRPIKTATMQRYLGRGQGYEKGPPPLVKQFLIQKFVRW